MNNTNPISQETIQAFELLVENLNRQVQQDRNKLHRRIARGIVTVWNKLLDLSKKYAIGLVGSPRG